MAWLWVVGCGFCEVCVGGCLVAGLCVLWVGELLIDGTVLYCTVLCCTKGMSWLLGGCYLVIVAVTDRTATSSVGYRGVQSVQYRQSTAGYVENPLFLYLCGFSVLFCACRLVDGCEQLHFTALHCCTHAVNGAHVHRVELLSPSPSLSPYYPIAPYRISSYRLHSSISTVLTTIQ